jgi:hypothetical protein
MGLGCKVVDFGRPYLFDQTEYGVTVPQIAIVEMKTIPDIGEVLKSCPVKTFRHTRKPVNHIAFFKEQFGEVSAILARDAGYQGDRHFFGTTMGCLGIRQTSNPRC